LRHRPQNRKPKNNYDHVFLIMPDYISSTKKVINKKLYKQNAIQQKIKYTLTSPPFLDISLIVARLLSISLSQQTIIQPIEDN